MLSAVRRATGDQCACGLIDPEPSSGLERRGFPIVAGASVIRQFGVEAGVLDTTTLRTSGVDQLRNPYRNLRNHSSYQRTDG